MCMSFTFPCLRYGRITLSEMCLLHSTLYTTVVVYVLLLCHLQHRPCDHSPGVAFACKYSYQQVVNNFIWIVELLLATVWTTNYDLDLTLTAPLPSRSLKCRSTETVWLRIHLYYWRISSLAPSQNWELSSLLSHTHMVWKSRGSSVNWINLVYCLM